ncbi:LLM class F420-dependent oxidoreductase [Mycobacterium paraintracellulare]|uniref:LLM class F420-dependent oxidoreductase n=1 Tax=Mycobacterium paraintracellulare TaxID=1138383 RepID=A0ABN6AM39_9MYCO|nr:LLM class F420-dependent oxidoreductase [Mycobacterium paraintracellulare]
MRFAFKTSPQNTTWAQMLAVWQAADDIDVYESGWTFDHFYPIFSDSSGPCLEGWTTLTALAQATTRLRLGTLVTGIHYRHPAVLANMAAALDIISNGRLELGIGAGWNEEESGAYGIELGSIKERFDRFEEACEVLTSLLTTDCSDFQGRFYQLKGARNEPKGPQRPHPPICIGGSGEKRTLRITARYAQHWNFVGGPPDVFAHKRDVLAAHCADIGRDPKEITLSAHLRLEPDLDYGKVVADAAGLAAEGLDLGIVYLPPATRPRRAGTARRGDPRFGITRRIAPIFGPRPWRSGENPARRPRSKPAGRPQARRQSGHAPKSSRSWAVTNRSCLAGNSRLFTG